MKNEVQRKKPHFQRPGLIFYCYLLIPLNELHRNALIINKLKNEKNFIVFINRSIQNAGKGVFGKSGNCLDHLNQKWLYFC
jgi:hypothetical protein